MKAAPSNLEADLWSTDQSRVVLGANHITDAVHRLEERLARRARLKDVCLQIIDFPGLSPQYGAVVLVLAFGPSACQ